MFLLDTNVISELRAGKPNQSPAVRAWAAQVSAAALYLSAVTVLELEMGVLRMERKDPRQGQALRVWLERMLEEFGDRVLPFGFETARHCAALHVPDPASWRDSLIAATACEHALTLVSRNVGDFQASGVSLLNPWDHQA